MCRYGNGKKVTCPQRQVTSCGFRVAAAGWIHRRDGRLRIQVGAWVSERGTPDPISLARCKAATRHRVTHSSHPIVVLDMATCTPLELGWWRRWRGRGQVHHTARHRARRALPLPQPGWRAQQCRPSLWCLVAVILARLSALTALAICWFWGPAPPRLPRRRRGCRTCSCPDSLLDPPVIAHVSVPRGVPMSLVHVHSPHGSTPKHVVLMGNKALASAAVCWQAYRPRRTVERDGQQ